jgi:perosamine synthetase
VISFYRPYFDWSEILALLRFGLGRDEFEAAVATRVGARYGLAFAYGRSGVIALFKALGMRQAEVILPVYTCSSMAEAVIVSGNKPVFVDIDLADYNMDIRAMKRALTPQTRAIIATHMYGYPADIDAIREQVSDDRVLIIEDAALALRPATRGKRKMSSDVALYSFGRGKQLYTIAGGVMVTNSSDLYERMKVYRDQKMSQLPGRVWARRCMQVLTAYMALNGSLEKRLVQIKNVGAVRRTREAIGLVRSDMPRDYATACADFQGRMGLVQLRKLDSVLERTRSIAEVYSRALQGIPGLTLAPMIPGSTCVRYTVRVRGRDEIGFRQRMWDEDIEVGLNFSYTLSQLKAYQAYATGQYPQAEQAAREVVNLPIYAGLDDAEVRRVVECIRKTMREYHT